MVNSDLHKIFDSTLENTEEDYSGIIAEYVHSWHKNLFNRNKDTDKKVTVFDINECDVVNYIRPTFNVASGITCTFKCGKDLCQNCELTKQKKITLDISDIIVKYDKQILAKSITFQGLEPLDNMNQLLWFIYDFRENHKDDIILWTGYTKEECADLIYLIKEKMKWDNIIIKFGRFIPNQKPHYDEILGVNLASDNQYAEKIS